VNTLELEKRLRSKIADEISAAWNKQPLKALYSGELVVAMILDFIRKGDGETLR
jgi:hypothetical protein